MITSIISSLVHETQRERGASSLYASSSGRLFGPELREQWKSTDERRAELTSFRDSNPAGLPRALAFKLDRTEEMLSSVVDKRGEIERLHVAAPEVIDRYTAVNAELLSIIDELAGRAAMARARFSALAWMALLHAKEKTGVERAQLSSVFAWDHFVDDQHAVISGLIAARQSYLHLFSVAAPQLARELMRRMLDSPVERAVSDMERVALEHREGGFGVDPAAWFTAISRKIDGFTEVEADRPGEPVAARRLESLRCRRRPRPLADGLRQSGALGRDLAERLTFEEADQSFPVRVMVGVLHDIRLL